MSQDEKHQATCIGPQHPLHVALFPLLVPRASSTGTSSPVQAYFGCSIRAPDSLLLELNPAAGWDPYSEREEEEPEDEGGSSSVGRYEPQQDEGASASGMTNSAAQAETPSSVDWCDSFILESLRSFCSSPYHAGLGLILKWDSALEVL